MYDVTKREKERLDVYIHPKVSKYKVVDFDKKVEILQYGIEEAAKFTTVFKAIGVKDRTR